MNWKLCVDSHEQRALKVCGGSIDEDDGYGDGYGDGWGAGGFHAWGSVNPMTAGYISYNNPGDGHGNGCDYDYGNQGGGRSPGTWY